MSYTPPLPPQPVPVAPNGQPLADFGNRLLAFLVDYAIYYGVSLLYTVPLFFAWLASISVMTDRLNYDSRNPTFQEVLPFLGGMLLFLAATVVLGLLFTYLYFVEYQLRSGQTVGKRVMKLKVIPVDPAGRLTRKDLMKRWGVEWGAAMFVPLFFYLDGLWQLWDKPLQQCIHDKAAATVVVRVG